MKYSNIQKFISYILLFLFFVNISINIPPIVSLVLARESSFYSLVSIIVDEKTYSEIKPELDRYSRDISNVLENTKVVILPVPENASVFQIASMNEAMYFDGYKSLAPVDFESKLMASIFVWKIPVPTVYKWKDFSRTILPYIDFEDKTYIYNHTSKRYEENKTWGLEIRPEVEFSFISPNTWDFGQDIKELRTFFDKDHDYYTWAWMYQQTNYVINWKKEDELNHAWYEPYVFYYDYFREFSSFNSSLYSSYKSTRQNIEDLTYNRYNSWLASKMKAWLLTQSTNELAKLAQKVDPSIDISKYSKQNPQNEGFDIQKWSFINKLKKNFVNSFSSWRVWELRKDVFNAWRYNFWKNVNVDFPSYVISNTDIVSNQYMKDASDDLEKYIDGVVEDGLSRKIAIPERYERRTPGMVWEVIYWNYLFWDNKPANAEKCTYYRWSLEGDSSQLVEANRWYNIMLAQPDIATLWWPNSDCLIKINETWEWAKWYWWKNSPLYLQPGAMSSSTLQLWGWVDYKKAVVPLFNINWSKQTSWLDKVPNPHLCFDNNFILEKEITETSRYELFGTWWTCRTDNRQMWFDWNHIELNTKPWECDLKVYLDWELVKEFKKFPRKEDEAVCEEIYRYRSIDSVIHHKSPTPKDISDQSQKLATENLPIDKNRYVDFIRADWKYVKINYPYLYRLDPSENTFEAAEQALITELNAKSEQINAIIARASQKATVNAANDVFDTANSHPYSGRILDIIWKSDPISQKLKKWEYPAGKKVDLLAYLKGKWTTTIDLHWEKKEISYYDLAVLSILWKKYDNPSEKYSFIFERYLSDEAQSKDKYLLPKTRKQYEIAYLWANWDAQNMMVSLDPAAKDENPYSDIIAKNQDLSSKMLWLNVANSSTWWGWAPSDTYQWYTWASPTKARPSDGLFKCAPPDWVPIWKWPSAISCRISNMLPPKITISDGHCSMSSALDLFENHSSNTPSSNWSWNSSSGASSSWNWWNTWASNGSRQSGQNWNSNFKLNNQNNGKSCVVDENSNWLSDCLEWIDSITLASDSNVYAYNDYVSLLATFYEKDKKATYVNGAPVTFEIVKIEKAKDEQKDISNSNLEVVYDITDPNLNNENIISDYVNFSSYPVRSSIWTSKYWFSTKNKDLNIYLRAKFTPNTTKVQNKKWIESPNLKVEVRSNTFTSFATKYDKKTNTLSNSLSTIESSSKPNVYLIDLWIGTFEQQLSKIQSFSESNENLIVWMSKTSKTKSTIDIKYPINIKLFNKDNIVQDLEIKSKQDVIKLSPLTDSWTYKLKITDSDSLSTTREIYVSASAVEKVDVKLWTNLLLSWWSVSTNILTLYDGHDNPVSGKRYIAQLELSNDNFVFIGPNWETKTVSYEIYEWFQAFRIKSTDKAWWTDLNVKIIDPETNTVVANTTQKIRSIENINVSLSESDISVWWETHKIKVSLRDNNWNILVGMNSRIYFSWDSNYFRPTKPYFDIVNSEAEVEITTKNLAWADIPVEIQIEWIDKIFNSKISIKPLKPVKVEVIVWNSKLEAKEDKYSTVYLELKDKFNNLVFTDSSTKANVSIDQKYSQILKYSWWPVSFRNWVANFNINATKIPWIWYFKVSTIPSLWQNSFNLSSDDNSSTKVDWVWENVWKIETFYFWNKEKVQRQHYNTLYTTLLWANYWDIEQKDYLAWALIFDKNSRALAVTSLLDSGLKKDNILTVNDSWAVREIFSKADLSQNLNTNIWIDGTKLYFNVYNTSLNATIWKVYYNLHDVKLGVCKDNLEDCFDKNNSSVVWLTQNPDYKFYNSNNKLTLTDKFWEPIFSVDSSGNFVKYSDIDFEINSENTADYLDLNLRRRNQTVWNFWIKTVGVDVNVSRNIDVFNSKKSTTKNSILVNIESNSYWNYKSWKELVIFYNDPLSVKSTLNKFTNSLLTGYENFPNKSWIGWWWENKTLLSFAAWKSVWASVKDYSSFYTINVWDPFVKLKKQKKTFSGSGSFKQFDSTIWKIISNDEELIDYKIFDYNNDKKDDLLLLKRWNYLELLENTDTEEKFVSHGNVAQVYDLWLTFETWDFTWDGYWDIFFIWTDWKPYILNNVAKDFTRLDLSNKLETTGKISQTSVFDMDNDGKTDIVVLDESGELSIFYGWWTSANPTFEKKVIVKWLWLTLWNDIKKDWWVLYYAGLYQPENMSPADRLKMWDKNIDKWVIDSEIYVNLPYNKIKPEDPSIENMTKQPNSIEQTYYLKSEYLSSVWINYEKTFKDRNGWTLVTWDIVDIEVKITNNSWRALVNASYLEKFENYFNIKTDTITNSKNIEISPWLWHYWFALNRFTLGNWETLTIKYSWVSRKLVHTTLRVWLFEKWEPWDDPYGDIIVDDLNINCWVPLGIYKSIAARQYQKSTVQAQCDTSKLPSEVSKLWQTSSSGWLPSKVEELKNNVSSAQQYSSSEMSKFTSDKDKDWIYDDNDNYSWDSISWWIDNLAQKISDALDNAENFLDWLSCWFNNGSCLSLPLNRAPLAPGNDPTFMWIPIGDGLKVEEWLPIFSMITWRPCKHWLCPSTRPPSVLWPNWEPGAWGRLWTTSPTNFFRLFVTPTLTGWIWTAICFWAPASVVWYMSAPPWWAPLFPGWNCIVLAKPLLKCSNDGSDWDPTSLGTPENMWNYWVINGWPKWWTSASSWKPTSGAYSSSSRVCSANTWWTMIDHGYVKDYINSWWWKNNNSVLWIWKFKQAMENHSTYDWTPLFRVWTEWWWTWISVTLSSWGSDDFSDIKQISEERITSFPEFLMDWVVRQIDEIVAKLTDFPTIFLVLPDFSWIYDSNKSWESNWKDFKDKSPKSKKSSKATWMNKPINQVNSWIREAFEFLSTLPLVNLNQEIVNINVPWISQEELNRVKVSRNETIRQREEEAKKYSNKWEYGDKVSAQINWLIGSIRKNLEIIEDYKNIPEKIKKLISKKEDYLEQILCNVESITDIMWGRIWKNGERFKAWVELYLLIKAILKAWQLFIDIFVNYEEECKECKNERHDLLNWEFQIISLIVPKIPVVEFPKWPDIVIDLHNIRASLDISIPEFVVNTKPINLPNLPNLNLPSIPDVNANLNLPDIPILPELKIPELPDLPSLPTIELPNLPPPLKLPKLFEGFEFIIDIAKLVVKAMCILKKSPLHPEWRAWDQIAFLTERNWFLWIDFISKSLPKFTLPYVDSINVVAYVNMELETDFIVEMAEQLVKPINSFTSDFTNVFKISLNDLDLSWTVPSSVDINADLTSYKDNLKNSLSTKILVADTVVKHISKGIDYMEQHKNETSTNEEFKKSVAKSLASEKITSNPQLDELREVWKQVNEYTFAGENKLISDLKNYNFEKYEAVKNIIITERAKNKNLEKDLQKMFENKNIKVSEQNTKSSIQSYNDSLDKYNSKTFENIWKIMNYDEKNSVKAEIKDLWQDLKNRSKEVFGRYSKDYKNTDTPLETYKKANNLLAANANVSTIQSASTWTCSANNNFSWSGSYNYYWIYIVENGRSYRLFDYVDEVKWDEVPKAIDYDNDWDKDLLYFVNNVLYLKENLENKPSNKVYLNEAPTVLSPSDNKYLNKYYIEAVNNAHESDIWNSIVNLSFDTLQNIYNYRMTYFDIVDKHRNLKRDEIEPRRNKNIVDWIAWEWEINNIFENDYYTKRKDLVYIDRIWSYRWLEMATYKMKSIRDDLNSGNTVTISAWTRLYSWPSYLELTYQVDSEDENQTLKLEPNTNIEAKEDLVIVWISRGNWYIQTTDEVVYNWDEISKMKWYPIPFGTKITFVWDKTALKKDSYIDLYYYDKSELRLDFNDTYSWELYDLWELNTEYLFSLNKKNDYYYAKLNWFKNNTIWTSTRQILLSPQMKADKNQPDIALNSIKVPVYQEVEIDITDKITEDRWVDWVSKLFIDFYLEKDTDGDLNPKNDDNSMPNLKAYKKDWKIFLKAWKFTTLIDKKIWVNVVDENWNVWFKEINFEVYSPIPEIEAYDWATISWKISEALSDEPINFYRFRWWNLTKLWDTEGKITVSTNDKWEFELKTWLFTWWLTLKDASWKDIASISEKTWKIDILTPENKLKYKIKVSKEENTNYPKIFIQDEAWKNIFNQILRVNWNSKVWVVNSFENLKKNGVYLKSYQNDFGYYVLPENISNNPWVYVWYRSSDSNQTPVFKIYPDGRLELPNSYNIDYSEDKDYIILKISDSSWKQLFDLLFKLDADYVIN